MEEYAKAIFTIIFLIIGILLVFCLLAQPFESVDDLVKLQHEKLEMSYIQRIEGWELIERMATQGY